MNVAGKFRWTYLPIILVLGLIWCEFWRFSTAGDAPPPPPEHIAVPEPAASAPAPSPVVATIAPIPPVEVATTQLAVELPVPSLRLPRPNAEPEPVSRFSTELRPISIRGSNLTLEEVVAALNKEMGPQSGLTARAGSAARFTLDAKDQSFWQIFREMARQNTVDFTTNEQIIALSATGATMVTGRGAAPPGLELQASRDGFRRFEINGPAMLMASSINLSRTSGPRGAGNPAPRCTLTLISGIDPRLRIADGVQFQDIVFTDDRGRSMQPAASTVGNSAGGNGGMHALQWTPPDDQAGKITFKCNLTFKAVITEATATLNDVVGKTDAPVTIGGRTIRVSVTEPTPGRLQIRVQSADGASPGANIVYWDLFDGAGTRVGPASRPISPGTGLSSMMITTPAGAGPYRMVLRGAGESVAFTLPFNLGEIPLP